MLRRANQWMDLLTLWAGAYVIPALIAFITVLSFWFWPSIYKHDEAVLLPIQVLQDETQSLVPNLSLLEAIGRTEPQKHFDTRLATTPFWFSFVVPPRANIKEPVVELPSRHAQSVACWRADSLTTPMGHATRSELAGAVNTLKAGFSLTLQPTQETMRYVCRGTFEGPARIQALLWDAPSLQSNAHHFHRSGGLLEGGLLVLSIFVLLVALMSKESTYLIFSAWLVANLRVAAISGGWDIAWLESAIPPEFLLFSKQLTIGVYYTLTFILFRQLFRRELQQLNYPKLEAVLIYGCVFMILLSVFLPFKLFLPAMWTLTALSVNALLFLLAAILVKSRSTVAIWYAGSIAFTLLSALSEVIAAAFGFKALTGMANSVTAALVSGLLAALAIAEQIRQERLQRIAAQAQTLQALDKVKATFEASPVGLFSMGRDGYFLQYNPAMQAMLSLISKNPRNHAVCWQDFISEESLAQINEQIDNGRPVHLEINAPVLGKASYWFLLQASLSDGLIEGSLQNISEQKLATDRLDFLAYHDPLTSVLNRRGIDPILQQALDDAQSDKRSALAYLDLDRFKLVNDLYGHVAGDEVLKAVTDRTARLLDRHHALARIGGDEFLIVMRETSIDSARTHCEGLLHLIESRPYRVGEKAFRVKASIGLVEITKDMSARDAIAAADRACRQAKKGRFDNLVVYEQSSEAMRERLEEIRLVEAISADTPPEGLFLEMQPIMSVHTPYKTLDFEALVRMREPNGNVIPAGKLVAAAEANGHVSVIDRWVLRTTLAWLDTHQASLTNTRFACVNISGGSLNDERFVNDIYAMLSEHRAIASQLCLEITEAVALQDLTNTRRFVDEVQSLGAKVALDDFGAGYTSFAYLKNLTADAVKIDGTFIRDLNRHPANYGIAKGIVDLAHNLGMRTVAEWVEDSATLETLIAIGIDYVQGYGIARPMAPDLLLTQAATAYFIQNESIAALIKEHASSVHQPELWEQTSSLDKVIKLRPGGAQT